MFQDPNLFMAVNFLLGLGVGVYGTLVGAGGGFLLVPMFLLWHGLPHSSAVGTSLAIVAANAVSGTAGYLRERRIDFRAGLVFAVFTFPGAVLGGFLTARLPGHLFDRVFGFLLCAASLYLLLRKPLLERPAVLGRRGWGWRERRLVTRSGAVEHYEYFEPLGALSSVLVGLISSLFGIGGGIIHVPLMTEVLRFPVHVAVATSHFVLGFTAMAGAFVHFQQGHVSLDLAVAAGSGAIVGAQFGVRISKRIKSSWILRALSLALLAVGVRLLAL